MKTRNTLRQVSMFLLLAFGLMAGAHAGGDTPVPTKDAAGLKDPAGLPRFTGSFLFLREDVDYDEVRLPASIPVYADPEDKKKLSAKQLLTASGSRARMMYSAPEGRSSLEVLRNYQALLKGKGYDTLYECSGDDCGPSIEAVATSVGSFEYLLNFLFPSSEITWANAAPSSCATGHFMSNVRYALLKNPSSGEVLAIEVHNPGDSSVYCDEASWKKHAIASVVYVKPKAMESNMSTLDAGDMDKSISETGKVAIYGILFDTASATIKPESKASLDEIAKLLQQSPKLGLHIVGHTDNQGTLPGNFDLSKRRAEAVKAALVKDHGIAAARLTANGVASLAPIAPNSNDEGRAKNRRVELVPF